MLLLIIGILFFVYSFKSQKKINFIVGILLIFVIMGFQSNVQSDYRLYQEEYLFCQKADKLMTRTSTDEPLWAGLMYAFSRFVPFWGFILFLSAVQLYILYIFISHYCKNIYLWLALCLFYFTFNMMLLQMYVIRQSFAVSIVLLSFICVDRWNKLHLSLFILLLAYLTHNSSIVALPFLLLYYFYGSKEDKQKGLCGRFGKINLWPIVTTVVFLTLYYFKDRLISSLSSFILSMDVDFRLLGYLSKESTEGIVNKFSVSSLIALYDAIIIFLSTWYFRGSGKKMQVFCFISIVTAFGDTLLAGLGSVPRIIMFLVLFNLPVYTSMASQLKKQYGSFYAMLFIVLLMSYAVKTSLPWMLEKNGDRFGNYRFIFVP